MQLSRRPVFREHVEQFLMESVISPRTLPPIDLDAPLDEWLGWYADATDDDDNPTSLWAQFNSVPELSKLYRFFPSDCRELLAEAMESIQRHWLH